MGSEGVEKEEDLNVACLGILVGPYTEPSGGTLDGGGYSSEENPLEMWKPGEGQGEQGLFGRENAKVEGWESCESDWVALGLWPLRVRLLPSHTSALSPTM